MARHYEQFRTFDYLKRTFAWAPDSVRDRTTDGRGRRVCFVKLRSHYRNSVELICMGSLLIGIPPKP
jgi:hypothetical protein